MRKLAWAARGISAVSGAVLLGALMVPSAAAYDGPYPDSHGAPSSSYDEKEEHKEKCAPVSRDIAAASPDTTGSDLVFRLATDRKGHAFLNDSRNPGVWINLGILANAPKCVVDTAITTTEFGGTASRVNITLLAKDGVIHNAHCTWDGTPFTAANLPTACGTGFAPLPDTPV